MVKIEFSTATAISPDADVRVEIVTVASLGAPLMSLDAASPVSFSVGALGFVAAEATSVTIPRAGQVPVVLIGVSEGAEDADRLRQVGAASARAVARFETVALVIGSMLEDSGPMAVRYLTEGFILGSYSFNKYRTNPDDLAGAPRVSQVTFVSSGIGASGADDEIALAEAVAYASCLARDLVNEPAGNLTPSVFAARAQEVAATSDRLEVEVWDLERIEQERLGGLLGVSRGSAEEPRMVKLTYSPLKEATKTIALVGKGITFDSGGLNIKSFDGMKTMKTDMGGAAAVLAAMGALPALEVGVKVVGFMMLTENLPSGTATKPGDVLVTRSGKTIEVLNTDAEGRLVLSDGLTLATEEEPDFIVDLATLTGACIVALGSEIAGVLGTSSELIADLSFAGEVSGEELWELPIPARYRKHIRSEIADMRNLGEAGQAGATAGAMLLAEFVGDIPWAHLDIAGPSRSDSDAGYLSKGGTGFGARLLCYFFEEFAS